MRRIFLSIFIFVVSVFSFKTGALAADFERFIMPVSNPVYNGDPRNVTMVRPIYLYQRLPDEIAAASSLGPLLKDKFGSDKIPLGGHVNGFAVQLSYAFNEKFSFVAVKDGYVDCKPDGDDLDWADHDGWADIAAGFQYSFLYKPEHDFIMTLRTVIEVPSGSDDVFQGNGDGNIAPSILMLKGIGDLQLNGTLGFVFPFSTSDENMLFYDSWHASYAVFDWFRPLIELNHFHVLKSGKRNLVDALGQDTVDALPDLDPSTIAHALHETSKTDKWDNLVAAASSFNGCDIINLGGADNGNNPDMVTFAAGARFRVTKWLDLGAVYEFALTDDENGLLKDRVMCDAMITFNF